MDVKTEGVNPKPLSEAKNPDLRGALAALQRVEKRVRELAKMHGTEIVTFKDGKIHYEKVV